MRIFDAVTDNGKPGPGCCSAGCKVHKGKALVETMRKGRAVDRAHIDPIELQSLADDHHVVEVNRDSSTYEALVAHSIECRLLAPIVGSVLRDHPTKPDLAGMMVVGHVVAVKSSAASIRTLSSAVKRLA